ncbi:MAG: hypothetical protein ACE14V_04235 [bacterium]
MIPTVYEIYDAGDTGNLFNNVTIFIVKIGSVIPQKSDWQAANLISVLPAPDNCSITNIFSSLRKD